MRWQGLATCVLQAAPAAAILSSATGLEYLCVLVHKSYIQHIIPEGHPLWTFAATHPPLRCLGIASDVSRPPARLFTSRATVALERHRPQLRLRCLLIDKLQAEFLQCDTLPD